MRGFLLFLIRAMVGIVAVAGMLVGLAALAAAQERAVEAANIRDASVDDVVRSLMLSRDAVGAGGQLTRSFRSRSLLPHTAKRPEFEQKPVVEVSQPRKHHYLNIQFALGSAELDIASREDLLLLATILRDPRLDGQKFALAGHTDAWGSEAYNLELSRRRALAVSVYLTKVLGIKGDRLVASGYGKNSPLPDRDPYDAENRRVEIEATGFVDNW